MSIKKFAQEKGGHLTMTNVVRYSSEGRIIEAESLEWSGRDLDLFDLLLQINPFDK